jgi:hypothetical protein
MIHNITLQQQCGCMLTSIKGMVWLYSQKNPLEDRPQPQTSAGPSFF